MLRRTGEVVRGRFDNRGRLVEEEVVEVIDPYDHAKFMSILRRFGEGRSVSSPMRSRTSKRRSMSGGGKYKNERARRLRKLNSALPESYVPTRQALGPFFGGLVDIHSLHSGIQGGLQSGLQVLKGGLGCAGRSWAQAMSGVPCEDARIANAKAFTRT